MISKSDLVSLLSELEDKGFEINKYMKELYSTQDIPLSVIKFINNNRPLEVAQFYEKLRWNYNHKKSDLYINIVKEIDDVEEIITTLSSYNLQVALFAKRIENKEMFYRNTRVIEVTKVLKDYYTSFDLEGCITILSLIKADIKLFEELKER